MAYTVYALSSTTKNYIYVGLTGDLETRLKWHQEGWNQTTKPYRPFQLIHTQNFKDRRAARQEEKRLKSGAGKEFLKGLKDVST